MKYVVLQNMYKFIFALIGIVLISAVPVMFLNGIHLSLSLYVEQVSKIFSSLIHPWDMTYNVGHSGTSYPLFPPLWEKYFYSLIIFISALVIALFFGIIFSYLTFLLPKRFVKGISFIASLIEVVPDIFVIVVFQFLVILVYQKTHILLFPIAEAFEKIYTLPILTLSILPTILFYRIMLVAFRGEVNHPYVELAQAKGLRQSYILLVHLLRNAMLGATYHVKPLLWFMLSNLVMVEVIFNIHGLIWFVFNNLKLDIIAVILILFYIPLFLTLLVIQIFLEKTVKQKVVL